MSNRTVAAIRGFSKSIKRGVYITDDNESIVKAVSFNLALDAIEDFIERLENNKVDPKTLEFYLKEKK